MKTQTEQKALPNRVYKAKLATTQKEVKRICGTAGVSGPDLGLLPTQMVDGVTFVEIHKALFVVAECPQCKALVPSIVPVQNLSTVADILGRPFHPQPHDCPKLPKQPETVSIELDSCGARLLRAIDDFICERLEWLRRDVTRIEKHLGLKTEP